MLQPLNAVGDTQGCRLANGFVRTLEGFKAARDEMAAGGWMGLAADPDHGGQGMPNLLNTAVGEIFSSANMAFQMYAGFVNCAALTLTAHGSAEGHLRSADARGALVGNDGPDGAALRHRSGARSHEGRTGG